MAKKACKLSPVEYAEKYAIRRIMSAKNAIEWLKMERNFAVQFKRRSERNSSFLIYNS
jgi:hypothetical protein